MIKLPFGKKKGGDEDDDEYEDDEEFDYEDDDEDDEEDDDEYEDDDDEESEDDDDEEYDDDDEYEDEDGEQEVTFDDLDDLGDFEELAKLDDEEEEEEEATRPFGGPLAPYIAILREKYESFVPPNLRPYVKYAVYALLASLVVWIALKIFAAEEGPIAGTGTFGEQEVDLGALGEGEEGGLLPPVQLDEVMADQEPIGDVLEPGAVPDAVEEPLPALGGELASPQLQAPGSGIVVAATTSASYSGIPFATGRTALVKGPDQALVDNTPDGPMPKIGPEGRKAWQVYARPTNIPDSVPRVALVVDGVGLSRAATEAVIDRLPSEVSLVYAPNIRGLDYWVRRSRAAGHEVLLGLPLEAEGFPFTDPGPDTLVTSSTTQENVDRLKAVMIKTSSYIGLMSVEGGRFNSSEDHLRAILEVMRDSGLMFLDGGYSEDSLAPRMAIQTKTPRAVVNVVLDADDPSRAAIAARLQEVEDSLRMSPVVVVRFSAYPSSLMMVSKWIATLRAKNIGLVPVSALVDKQLLLR